MSAGLLVPDDIPLLPQPPRSADPTPVETIRQVMRDTWLSTRILRPHDDIVDHCRDAWNRNRLVDRPWRIMTNGRRDRTHAFRSLRAGTRAQTAPCPRAPPPPLPRGRPRRRARFFLVQIPPAGGTARRAVPGQGTDAPLPAGPARRAGWRSGRPATG